MIFNKTQTCTHYLSIVILSLTVVIILYILHCTSSNVDAKQLKVYQTVKGTVSGSIQLLEDEIWLFKPWKAIVKSQGFWTISSTCMSPALPSWLGGMHWIHRCMMGNGVLTAATLSPLSFVLGVTFIMTRPGQYGKNIILIYDF